MKKKYLDIIIAFFLFGIMILLILLLWPVKNQEEKKTVTSYPEEKNVKSTKNSSSKTLFTDTKEAKSEDEVVSYVEEINQDVEQLSNSKDSKNIKEKLEDTFITFTDFIFYGGTIKGVTFQELSLDAKNTVLDLYYKLDKTIESKYPNYKETIQSTTENSYTTAIEKAKELKDSLITNYKETVGEDTYHSVVSDYESNKDRLKDSYQPYLDKGKDIIDQGKEAISDGIDQLDTWYQNFKESRG